MNGLDPSEEGPLKARVEQLENQLAQEQSKYADLLRAHESLLNSKLGKISSLVSRTLTVLRRMVQFVHPGHIAKLFSGRVLQAKRRRAILRLRQNPPSRIDVIIPVYKGIDETQACIESARASIDPRRVELVVINDASPEPDLVDYLESQAQHGAFTLLSNESNLGFVETVNRGMALHDDRDIVLLNSDTLVCGDWVQRLRRCAYTDPFIASVTPFSNNATICSYPHFCWENPLPEGETQESMDAHFSSELGQVPPIEIPTAVGFCMYIKRASIVDVGVFDQEAFGKGYGEENDFCMRAKWAGWKHVLCPNTFVYHAGGTSFSEDKEALVEQAMKVLEARYPTYHRLVRQHIKADPAKSLREAVTVRRLLERRLPSILFLHHGGIGGVERHMNELAQMIQAKAQVVSLKPIRSDQYALTWESNSKEPLGSYAIPSQRSELIEFLQRLNVSRIHIHHTLDLHPQLWQLAESLDVPQDYTLHDYYALEGSPKMVGTDDKWVAEKEDRDRLCVIQESQSGKLERHQHRQEHKRLLDASQRIFSPSRFTTQMYLSYYPDLNITTAPHPDMHSVTYPPVDAGQVASPQDRLSVLVIGALGPEKGADPLEACAKICKQEGFPIGFQLLGYAYRDLDPLVRSHGPYKDSEIQDLIRRSGADIVWFPALWPETYCYTLSEVIKAGMPIVAPNIGAFPERLAGREWTWIEPWDQDPVAWAQLFERIRTSRHPPRSEPPPLVLREQHDIGYSDFDYAKSYIVEP